MQPASLPGVEFWDTLRPFTGEVTSIQRTERGFSSDLTALVVCEAGTFFVKAVRNQQGGRLDSLTRERLINPHVVPVSPPLRWTAETAVWAALGFEAVAGRHADFTPGSPDLPAVVGQVDRIGRLELPSVAESWAETRWDRFADDAASAALLAGDALLHTDINGSNILLSGPTGWVVDWAWPTRGAGFIDPACLVLQLIAAGHSAPLAERWASGCTVWLDADPKGLDVFASANVRMFRHLTSRKPDAAWLRSMTDAAEAWAVDRGVPLP